METKKNDIKILPPKLTSIVRQQMSRAIQTGFHCGTCGVDTATYDESSPDQCMNCHTPNPKRSWQNIITTVVTTEKIVV